MKFKTRLVVAFFTIILIPLVLSSALVCMVGKYQLSSIEKNYGIKNTTVESLASSVTVLTRLTEQPYRELEALIRENPEEMEDAAQLESLNGELQDKKSYLLVRKNDTIAYIGTEASKAEKVISQLPEYGAAGTTSENGMYLGGKAQVLLKQIDFQFADGTEGSAFIVTRITSIFSKTFLLDMFLAIIFILVLTAMVLTQWIHKDVFAPINRLNLAMQKIAEGNFDYMLESEDDNEIGELYRNYEDMRLRLKESTEEKIQNEKQNRELISNITHDLKTPITAIKGYVEGIRDGVADTPEKMEKYIGTIYNKANEMDTLINELTLYAKIDTNRIPYNFAPLSVNDYFNDCAEDIEMELDSKNVEFGYFNYVEGDQKIIADPEQLKRVINNIVSNSLKYMEREHGLINLRVKDVGDFIQVELEDNGKGIAAKDLPNIFDRFYRTDASRNSSKGGSGIGLSIVKKIIEDHGGKIWATSREGVGTVMYFVIRKYQEVPINE